MKNQKEKNNSFDPEMITEITVGIKGKEWTSELRRYNSVEYLLPYKQ